MVKQESILQQIPIFRVTALHQNATTDKMILESTIYIKITFLDIKSL